MDTKMVLSAGDVAEILGISKAGVYNLCHMDGFPCIWLGRRVVIPRDHLMSWIDKLAMKQTIIPGVGEDA